MNSFIVFDVDKRLAEVKAGLRKLGYFDSWKAANSDPKIYHLPHNAVWKRDTELSKAKTDLFNVIISLNTIAADPINILRCIVVPVTPWDGIEGTPSS